MKINTFSTLTVNTPKATQNIKRQKNYTKPEADVQQNHKMQKHLIVTLLDSASLFNRTQNMHVYLTKKNKHKFSIQVSFRRFEI